MPTHIAPEHNQFLRLLTETAEKTLIAQQLQQSADKTRQEAARALQTAGQAFEALLKREYGIQNGDSIALDGKIVRAKVQHKRAPVKGNK